MEAALVREVWNRAQSRCEYCQIPATSQQTPFQIDHVIARKHGGDTIPANLALACYRCNLYKGPNIAGLDDEANRVVRLFNPRQDQWSEHLQLRHDGRIVGRTDVGRATVFVLSMNHPDLISLRALLIAESRMVAG